MIGFSLFLPHLIIVAPGQLIGGVIESEPGTGFASRCGRYLSLVLTYAVNQTVQIRGIMTTESITDSRRIKNVNGQ